MKTITIGNTKGGTAKTTTSLNMATELGLLGHKTLLIDFDPQASLGKAVKGEQELSGFKGIEELLTNQLLNPADFITATKINNVYIIPCHAELGETALKLVMKASFYSLKDVLRKITGFDFVILDTQPSKNILMLNAFTASDYILIPTNPGVYPLMDILELEETIRSTAQNSNPNLQILGVLITMVQRGTIYKQLEEDLRDYFKDKVFKTTISRLVKSEESAVEGIGVSGIDPDCKLAHQYRALAVEILKRLCFDSAQQPRIDSAQQS
jgi:chromosome partitioning protein